MKTFKDKEDTKWEIDLPFGTVLRIKADSEGKFNLLEPFAKDGKSLSDCLWEDLGEFYEVLWHIVEPQATAKSINADQFGQLMAADCIVAARLAFFEEWTDFFRSLQRPNIATALEKTTKYNAAMTKAILAKMDDPKLATMDQRVTTKIQSELSKQFGGLLDSLDKILEPSPGDS